ncbi:hypothetical protein WK75_27540 [Burkholderia ubonensis]|nr:hypothetical protein WK75_27540 [Burkholderia ubonensis]
MSHAATVVTVMPKMSTTALIVIASSTVHQFVARTASEELSATTLLDALTTAACEAIASLISARDCEVLFAIFFRHGFEYRDLLLEEFDVIL